MAHGVVAFPKQVANWFEIPSEVADMTHKAATSWQLSRNKCYGDATRKSC